jgi:hypothetical protein
MYGLMSCIERVRMDARPRTTLSLIGKPPNLCGLYAVAILTLRSAIVETHSPPVRPWRRIPRRATWRVLGMQRRCAGGLIG